MGIPVVVVGKQHICPMSDGSKPHVGGMVSEGINGVFIDGLPVAIEGSKCMCCSPKPNSITSGACGVLIDGKPIAVLGSQTEHGGNVIEGVPGVTVSGGFATKADNPEEFEPRVFNLQWKKDETRVRYGEVEENMILSADTVGYEDGEEVTIKVYASGEEEAIDEVKGTVRDGRIEVEWQLNSKGQTDGEGGTDGYI